MRTRLRSGTVALALLLACVFAGCSDDGGDDDASTGEVAVSILSPVDGDRYDQGESVVFLGSGYDADGALTGAQLRWSSSLDGDLGSGETFTRDDLSAGDHLITLVGTNPAGAQASASVSIQVTAAGSNLSPAATIRSPEEGAQVVQGETVTLSGEADDPEDGALTGSSLVWTSSIDGLLGSGSSLRVSSLSVGEHLIILTAIDSAGATGQAAVGIRVFAVGQNVPPTATILEPDDGATVKAGDPLVLSGAGTDLEDGTIPEEGLAWRSSLDGALGTGKTLTVSLSQGVHVLTLTATDSEGASGTASVSIAVNPQVGNPPAVTILKPSSGATFTEGTAVVLEGQGSDPEDGPLPDSGLAWSSSLDGALGTGKSLTVSSLSVGLHTVLLVGTDSGGASATASIQVRINEKTENQAPTAGILQPEDGATFQQGTSITFKGQGIDPEDGTLKDAALSWRSDRDGALGTGGTLTTASLSAGTHHITLTAIDGQAATGSDTISLTITSKPVENKSPTALLAGPATAMARAVATFDGSGSSDADGTVVRYVFEFGDGAT